MTRIGLISDTHGYLDEQVFRYFKDCDEIWHAGDFGSIEIADRLKEFKSLKGVYGNIDGNDVRRLFPEKLQFKCEQITVYMTHIGGYPGKYASGIGQELIFNNAHLFISGHSHILKIIYDDRINCLHINPGAAGREGWHKVRTIVRFSINGEEIKDCEVIELGKK
ncbi:MAG: metallophosphoesterase family protein [Chitinophagaceae bacterium]|nr:metallophosphoesterase family protein [Chitinophagaceae bacterium]